MRVYPIVIVHFHTDVQSYTCPLYVPFLSLLLLSYICELPMWCTAKLLCRRQDTAGRLVQSWSTIVGAGRRGTPASPDISGDDDQYDELGLFVFFAMLMFETLLI